MVSTVRVLLELECGPCLPRATDTRHFIFTITGTFSFNGIKVIQNFIAFILNLLLQSTSERLIRIIKVRKRTEIMQTLIFKLRALFSYGESSFVLLSIFFGDFASPSVYKKPVN